MCQCFPYFKIQDPAINQIRHKIRYALDENNPGLVELWLSMEESLKGRSIASSWLLYSAQYKLLIEVLSDDLLPKHWRVCCLDNIYKPLSSLGRIAINEAQRQQLNKFYYELRVISHYFQSGLS
jgi:hypothetical protein